MNPAQLLNAFDTFPHLGVQWSPKQQQVIDSTHKRLCVRAATQVGKSFCCARKAIKYALDNPGSIGLIVTADHRSKREVIGKALHDLMPAGAVLDTCDWNMKRGWRNDVITFHNGSQILFRSGESSQISLAGLTVDWVWFDEPPPSREVFTEALQRVAVRSGNVFLSFTAVGRDTKWLRKIIEGDPETDPPTPPSEDWHQIVMQLTVEDCPHRSAESIAAQIGTVGSWEYSARVLGAWESETVDRVFDGFTETSVVSAVKPGHYRFGLGMDHGELAGSEAAVLALWDKSHISVIDTYVSQTATDPEQDGKAIRDMLTRHQLTPKSIDLAVGDINRAGKADAGRTVNEMLEAHLQPMQIQRARKGSGSIEYGVRLINVALRRGHLTVHERCEPVIRSMKHWRNDRATEDLKHIIDGMRYLLVPILEDFYSPAELDRIRMVRA